MGIRGAVRSSAAVSVAIGAAFATTVALAGPANASLSECGTGRACLWYEQNYSGGLKASVVGSLPAVAANTSSAANFGTCGSYSTARYYEDQNYQNRNFILLCPGSGDQYLDPNLSNGTNRTTANWENRVESLRFTL